MDIAKIKYCMEKQAGLKTEIAGAFTPHGLLGAIPGAIAAGVTPTRTDEEQLKAHKETWKNLLIPGRATYNNLKRVGNMTKGKLAAPMAEYYNLPNRVLGSVIGGVAAAVTPTKTPEQSLKSDRALVSKLLVPGKANYDSWKRLGASQKKFNDMERNQKSSLLHKAAQEAPGKNHRVASVLSEAKAVASKLKPGPWHIGEAPNPAPGSRSLNTYTKK